MKKLEYPLVGYAAQYAEQDAIFERYGKHMHICVIDPDAYRIETPEQMEKMVADFGPFIKDQEQEMRYMSGEDPEPNLFHVEINDFKSHFITDAYTAIKNEVGKDAVGKFCAYPPKSENSGGRMVITIKDDIDETRFCFEFSLTGNSAPMTVNESTQFAVNTIKNHFASDKTF